MLIIDQKGLAVKYDIQVVGRTELLIHDLVGGLCIEIVRLLH